MKSCGSCTEYHMLGCVIYHTGLFLVTRLLDISPRRYIHLSASQSAYIHGRHLFEGGALLFQLMFLNSWTSIRVKHL